MSRLAKTSCALAQLTPSPNTCHGVTIELASPTPIIEPTKVCELDAGSPKYQVPTFQIIAEISSAKTIAKPAPDPTFRTSSTGNNATMPNATAPLDVSTPIKLQKPDQTTATTGRSECASITAASTFAASWQRLTTSRRTTISSARIRTITVPE